ncbi:uncharacterized protein misp isoform X2 [Eucyclogobius newberryi]|uniref:uncharacterized protein misp isoform X2 n=1 Tax=Eucyclogobius newberryi TaxID=166745 RepID=UPI003B5B1582
MFKYTSPWQVLVCSLEPHKRLSGAGHQDDLSTLHLFTPVQGLTPDPSPTVMDRTPRRWELRPLSPSLQPSDLRSISAQQEQEVSYSKSISIVGSQSVYVEGRSDSLADVTVEARQVSVSRDEASSSDELPISPSSSTGSHSGFYSFVEDPFSPEAEQNEAWMVSPQRQSNLATLREEKSFKLQTYSSHSTPGSLFQDISETQYEISPRYGYKVVNEVEERKLRKEIIRGQAPKKGPMVEKEMDSPTNDTSRLIEGLSISYSHVKAKPKPAYIIDSEAIDQEQINFDAARKQFILMEQSKLDPIIRPREIQVKVLPKLKQDAIVLARREEQVFTPSDDDVDAEEKDDLRSNHSRTSSSLEDSDRLPLIASYSSIDALTHEQILPENDANQISIAHETPIEREIRIAQEREENLRRSRGLQHSVSGGEMIKIRTKRLNSLPLAPSPSQTKEKVRVSFIFQEIQRREEANRQDGAIQNLGGPTCERVFSFDVPQSNDIESNQEYVMTKAFETLKENRRDEAKLDVVDYALQKLNYTAQDGSKVENRQDNAMQAQEYGEPYTGGVKQEEKHNYSVQNDQALAKNYEFEGSKSLEERWHNQNGDGLENGYKSIVERSRVDSFSNEVFQLPCCPHKHSEDSDPSKKGPRLNSPRAASPQTPAWRDTLERTGLQTRGQAAAEFIERDIEEAMRREQELREQREARVKLVYSPQTLVHQADKIATTQFYPQNNPGKLESRSSSFRPGRLSSVPLLSPQPWSPAPQTQSPAVFWTTPQTPLTASFAVPWTTPRTTPQTLSATLVQTTPFPVRGLTQTLLQGFEERRSKLKLEESKVVESTRVTRHKNQKALQWEAGLFANQQDQ